ncbi:hypothetical protein [Sulfurimonas marina]|uniref:AsmA family protein n=1 Tax=Sulfurimonas marina TaxID=2590551 RepID=A0A7M1AWE1_9BACT|nr:hypothetical protein [Sulfurimonas marina]QOP40692.1 hypothetical protein FJR03_02615 [Sulfurimonas marina]
MKYLKWIIGIFILILASVYTLVFTSFGNSIVKPILEEQINKEAKLNAKVETFKLSMSEIEVVIWLPQNNILSVKGEYSLFSQSFNLNYMVDLKDLASLKHLTQTELNGSFFTDGTIVGDKKLLEIKGKSDLGKSDTTYYVKLNEFNPSAIIAKVEKADLKTLLHMVNKPAYASAVINLDLNFKNITPHQLDGDIKLTTLNGTLNSEVMRKDFNIKIPKTDFKMKLDAKLQGDDIDYNYLLNSNLAKISSEGKVVPEPLAVDLKYALDVQELAVLKPITNADIRGNLKLNGDVKGSKEQMKIKGKTDIAGSNTTFQAVLKEFEPKTLQASIKHLKLQKLLYMVKQPHYADATFDLSASLSSLDMNNLKGNIKTAISEGVLDSKYLSKTYEFKTLIPRTTFNATTFTTLDGNLVDTKLDLNSNLANLDIKRARFNLKDSSLQSDYKVNVDNLDKFYFVTERHLKGSILANGELKKDKDLDFTALSNIAGGKLDAKLHNDDFVANISNMDTLKILDILIYPKLFKSDVDAKVKYNLATASGTCDAKLKDGLFMSNQALDLTKKYAKIDLYKQKFFGDLNAKIKKENIVASLDLKSNTSSIKTTGTKLNSKTKQIDSKVAIVANNNPAIYVKLTGDANAPKVQVDASALIKDEAKKVINKEVNKLFKKLF